jgi:hypothetical protein
VPAAGASLSNLDDARQQPIAPEPEGSTGTDINNEDVVGGTTTPDSDSPGQTATPQTENGGAAGTTHRLRPMLRGPIGMLGPRIRDFVHRGHGESATESQTPSSDAPPSSKAPPARSAEESGGS